jgi:hypothetical protein
MRRRLIGVIGWGIIGWFGRGLMVVNAHHQLHADLLATYHPSLYGAERLILLNGGK